MHVEHRFYPLSVPRESRLTEYEIRWHREKGNHHQEEHPRDRAL
jgi:hypothetical protein